MTPLRLLIVHQDEMGMRFGGDHPTDQRRHRLAMALCREAGILDLEGVGVEAPPAPLSDAALEGVFAPAFVRAVRRYSERPVLAGEPEARQWGIGGDITPYAGMHEDSARVGAACARASAAVAGGASTATPSRSRIPASRQRAIARRWRRWSVGWSPP